MYTSLTKESCVSICFSFHVPAQLNKLTFQSVICRIHLLDLGISVVQTEKTFGNYCEYLVGGQREGS